MGSPNPHDLLAFKHWLRQVLTAGDETEAWLQTLSSLPGDAGFRRYFTFTHPAARGLICAISPPQTEKNTEFVEIARHLSAHKVRVPEIKASNLELGFLLLENLGQTLYLDHLTPQTVDSMYTRAMTELMLIQQSPANQQLFPLYNRARLGDEMQLFADWFVSKLLGYPISHSEVAMLKQFFRQLEDAALEQPQVVVHRDFHSRNIVYGDGGIPGVIDFQDAVIGPFTYDLVSLLRDCYIEWPDERVENWALAYLTLAVQEGITPEIQEALFIRWFDWMGLQRHIKVLGIFSRLFLRDNKARYLNDLPLVIRYTLKITGKYSQFKPFYDWFILKIQPLIDQQFWMKT